MSLLLAIVINNYIIVLILRIVRDVPKGGNVGVVEPKPVLNRPPYQLGHDCKS